MYISALELRSNAIIGIYLRDVNVKYATKKEALISTLEALNVADS